VEQHLLRIGELSKRSGVSPERVRPVAENERLTALAA
jgi:hypothetical protein